MEASQISKTLIEPDIQEPYQMRYRWVMLSLVSLMYCIFGMVNFTTGPLITPIIRDLGVSYSQMGLIMGAWPLTYIIVAFFSGSIIDRWGIRKSLFTGIILIGLSAGLRFFANDFITMFLCVALFGIGGPMISIGSPKTISLWFRGRDRATAVGVYTSSSMLGGVIAFSATNSVFMPVAGYNWRLVFVGLGLVAFTAAFVWWILARDIKAKETTENISILKVFTSLIGIRNVKVILIMGFLYMVIGHGLSNWLPNLLETAGLSPSMAGLGASLPRLVSIPASLFAPRLVPPHMRGRVIAIMSVVGAAAILVVTLTSGIPMIIGLVLLGTVQWAGVPLMMLVLMDMPEIDSKYLGSVGGMYFCIAEIGGVVGPYMMGALVDTTGNFIIGAVFLAFLRVLISGMATMLRIRPAS